MQVLLLVLMLLSLAASTGECSCDPMIENGVTCYCFSEVYTDHTPRRCAYAVWRLWICVPPEGSSIKPYFKETCSSATSTADTGQYLPLIMNGAGK